MLQAIDHTALPFDETIELTPGRVPSSRSIHRMVDCAWPNRRDISWRPGLFRFLPQGDFMTQPQLNRAVARATGESRSTIHRMGFSLLDPPENLNDLDALPRPQTVNWDRLDARRPGFLPQRARCRRKSA